MLFAINLKATRKIMRILEFLMKFHFISFLNKEMPWTKHSHYSFDCCVLFLVLLFFFVVVRETQHSQKERLTNEKKNNMV